MKKTKSQIMCKGYDNCLLNIIETNKDAKTRDTQCTNASTMESA